MTRYAKVFYLLIALVAMVAIVSAQTEQPAKTEAAAEQPDRVGKPDTLYAEIGSVNPNTWTITISVANDEPIVALSVPLRMTAGLNKIVADSAIFTGGRIAKFAQKFFRADTAIQCVLIGGIANMGGPRVQMTAGTGRVATIFVSSLEKKPIEKLSVDTTTVNPSNSLQMVSDSMLGASPDSPKIDRKDWLIVPVFVVRESK
jgi:hypothetical protein